MILTLFEQQANDVGLDPACFGQWNSMEGRSIGRGLTHAQHAPLWGGHDLRNRRRAVKHGNRFSVPHRAKVFAEPRLQLGDSDLSHGHIMTRTSHITTARSSQARRFSRLQPGDLVRLVKSRAYEGARSREYTLELVVQPDQVSDKGLDFGRRGETKACQLEPRVVRPLDAP